ncbi:MAG: DUF192 domain-containing protein [Candidatus Paceibacterota bacterium]
MFGSKVNRLIVFIFIAVVLTGLLFIWPEETRAPADRAVTPRPEETDNSINKTVPSSVLIAGQVFTLEIADTPRDRAKGLAGRQELPANHGMLFIFPTAGNYNFWMKEMNFPLDIIWLDEDLTIIDLTENFSPETYPETITSKEPAKYVLEIKAGLVERLNLTIGNTLELK